MKQKSFILSYEKRANIITTRILLISILAFPALIILGLLKVFAFDMPKLYVFCAIGAFGAFSPFIFRKIGLNSTYLKYFTILMSTVVVAVLNVNYQIGIYMMFLLPIALSCLYFDKKLTVTALVLGILSMVLTFNNRQYCRRSIEIEQKHLKLLTTTFPFYPTFLSDRFHCRYKIKASFEMLTYRSGGCNCK